MKSVVDIVEKSKPYFSKYVYLVFNLFVYKTSYYSLILIKLINSFQARSGLVLQVGRYKENCKFICGSVS